MKTDPSSKFIVGCNLYTMNLPNHTTMSVIATLKNECNLQEKFNALPVVECNFKELLPNGIISIVKPPHKNYLDITIKLDSGCKSVHLTKYSAKITSCKDLEEASLILEELKLEVFNISEDLVNYLYDMPIKEDYLELFKQFPDFIVEHAENVCKLRYKKTLFRIQNNKVRQSSRCTEEAREAYNEFMSKLQAV